MNFKHQPVYLLRQRFLNGCFIEILNEFVILSYLICLKKLKNFKKIVDIKNIVTIFMVTNLTHTPFTRFLDEIHNEIFNVPGGFFLFFCI